jgi:hypothetical protein
MSAQTGWGIALQAIGNLGEGISGVIGSNQIANTQTNAIDTARNTYNKYYDQAKGIQQPYADMGMKNTQSLDQMVNNGDFQDKSKFNFQQDPGYQYQLSSGNQAIQQNAGALGSLFSGATMKALTKYGSNLANQQYQAAYGRYVDQRNFNQTNLTNNYSQRNNLSNMGIQANKNLTDMTLGAGNENSAFDLARGNVNAQRIASNVGNTQGVFKSISDVGGGLVGSDTGGGMGGMGGMGGGGGQSGGQSGSQYNTGMIQNNSSGMLGNNSQLGNGNYQNLGMQYNMGSGYGGGY